MEPIVYRPLRSYRVIGIIILLFGAFFFVLAILNMHAPSANLPMTFFLVPVYLAFSVYFFCMSKITVVATDTGLQINDSRKSHFTAWNELKAFHMSNSWKGHEFLVLSSAPISPKEAKRIINRSSISTKLYYDGYIVILVDPLQNNHAIFKFAQQRISNSQYQ